MRDVSVLLATFNGAKHLSEQLASISEQTAPPLEIVISDDGSTDSTLSIVQQFRQSAKVETRVIKGDGGLGASENFLNSLTQCRGRFIAYCDQDDVWNPRKLEVSRTRLGDDGTLLAIHTAILTDAALKPTGLMSQGILRDNVLQPGRLDPYLGSFSGWGNTMMFDASIVPLLTSSRPLQPATARPLSHDTWTYVLSAALGRVSHIHEPLIFYRQHDSNVYGVEVETRVERVRSASRSPVAAYSARSRFYQQCATAFESMRDAGTWNASDSTHAASLYRRRSQQVLLRRSIYTSASRSGRLRSLVAYYCLNGPIVAFGESRGAGRFTSLAKDLLRGVIPASVEADGD